MFLCHDLQSCEIAFAKQTAGKLSVLACEVMAKAIKEICKYATLCGILSRAPVTQGHQKVSLSFYATTYRQNQSSKSETSTTKVVLVVFG